MKTIDAPIYEVIAEYAMECPDLGTIQYMLFLAADYPRERAIQIVFDGNEIEAAAAEWFLEEVGYLK